MVAVVIDDDAENLNILAGIFKELCPESLCICFLHPDEALRVIANELKRSPDYIFIDVNMNVKGGTDCLRYLRTRKELNECKIIMFSAVMPHAVIDAFKSLGADDAFQKPTSKCYYKDVIKNVLNDCFKSNDIRKIA